MPASRWSCRVQGALRGGSLALLSDYAIHGAVQSVLAASTAGVAVAPVTRFAWLHSRTQTLTVAAALAALAVLPAGNSPGRHSATTVQKATPLAISTPEQTGA